MKHEFAKSFADLLNPSPLQTEPVKPVVVEIPARSFEAQTVLGKVKITLGSNVTFGRAIARDGRDEGPGSINFCIEAETDYYVDTIIITQKREWLHVQDRLFVCRRGVAQISEHPFCELNQTCLIPGSALGIRLLRKESENNRRRK